MAIDSIKDIDKRNQNIINRIVSTEYPKHCRFVDISGNDYGDLHVDSYYGKDKRGQLYFWCTCKCGSKILVRNTHLMYGDTHSCGCGISKVTIERNKEMIKHGATGSRLHDIWTGMCQRCDNPRTEQYPNYGGRGIKICDEWRNLIDGFANFRHWSLYESDPPYNDKLTIDRIDPGGDYCPENCRWTDQKHQDNNKRNTIYFQLMTYVLPLTIWSEITGISRQTLYSRYKWGWTDSEILLTPPGCKEKCITTDYLYIDPKYNSYNKYDDFVKSGKIKPYEV